MGAIVAKWAQVSSDVSDSDSYGLWVIQGTGGAQLFAAIHQSGPKEPTLQGGSIPLNTWSHVAMTFDAAGAYNLYVNGKQVATSTAAGPLLASVHNAQIGREDSYIGRLFDGLIDEATVYNRSLSAAEVLAMTESG